MLRALIPLLALAAATVGVGVDALGPGADDRICTAGGCRYDQLYSALQARGATREALSALAAADPSNPHAWADFGDSLASAGDSDAAARVFAHAVDLGSGLAPVLMRAANFDFTHGRRANAMALLPRILEQAADFDEILFSYVMPASGALSPLPSPDTIAGRSPRAARSWLAWETTHATVSDVVATWEWVHRSGFADPRSAQDVVNGLWQRGAFQEAQRVWVDWLGPRVGDYPNAQALTNTRFETEPGRTPLDWDLSPRHGVELTRDNGLAIRFTGRENVSDVGVVQHAVVHPGRYLLTIDASADDISTDRGVFVEISDTEHPDRLTTASTSFLGSAARHTTTADVVVPSGTRVLRVRLARTPSWKFDNQLGGVLHVYQVSLASR